MKNNLNIHRPFHLYDEYCYAISARTYERTKYFSDDERKKIFVKKLNTLSKKFDIGIIAWVLVTNHYHLIISLPEKRFVNGRPVLSEFLRQLHSQIASVLNQLDGVSGRQIWYQYWDHCMRNKPDFWYHFNYIIQNPLKHRLVKTLIEAYHYKFSSNPVWLERFGESGLSESFIHYPVKDWTPDEGDEND